MEELMKLVTVEEMKQLEQAADAAGHTYAAMMENAGRAVAHAIQERISTKGKRMLVLVGPGNNGGDGLVAARHLCQAGAQIVCYLWQPRSKDDPNLQAIQQCNVHCIQSDSDGDGKTLRKALRNADVIIDALLGTGAKRPIKGTLKKLLTLVRQVAQERRESPIADLAGLVPRLDSPVCTSLPSPFIVAVDVPSGLDCDTGAVDPATLRADLTVTFAAAKRGQFTFPGAEMVGELVVADIGIDPAHSQDHQIEVASPQSIGAMLPSRPPNAHKGTFGKAMIVAGSINYTGAPYLAAAATARVGAGLVTLAPPQSIYSVLATKLSEATFLLLPHEMGVLVPAAIKVLGPKLTQYTTLLIGPGLGREKQTIAFVHQLLGMAQSLKPRRIGFQHSEEPEPEGLELPPLVIDADGLNALAKVEAWWTYVPENTILTPHPGEMARLTGLERAEINSNRIAIARDYAHKWNQVVVLKGAFTVVAAPDGHIAVVPFANPGLATAGTGDVLAGAIAGMLAQDLSAFDAAVCGAYLHGLAGEIVSRQLGTAGMLASDLLLALPEALSRLRITAY
jgi:NAD(P)H-hydrate epimerase